ncbi:MAG TPA: beta-propeller fold lactonase family protein [Pseudonocardiaceae bacterium]|nr:beta-propeller fold lactonase family protein [Pseudonocardiaceae bacterium]
MSMPTPPKERVYALTNAADGNAVAVFVRQESGNLIPLTSPPPPGLPGPLTADGVVRPLPAFRTGGLGAGGPLVSQSAVTLSQDRNFLFAVNPGSNELTSFLVTPSGLQFASKVPSGGVLPVSVTTFGNLVYVVNAVNNLVGSVGLDGPGTGQIAGFTIDRNGVLTPLEDSGRALSSPFSGPAQVAFNPDGTLLVVTELAANRITVFQVEEDGRPGAVMENNSAGRGPFGFAFNAQGHLIVSELGNLSMQNSSVSSYAVSPDGELTVISAAVPTKQGTACWIANTPDGRFSYSANTLSGSVSGFSVKASGELTLLTDDGRTGVTGDTSLPIDMVIGAQGRYLDVLTQGTQTIMTFRINSTGCLTPLASVGNLPPVAVGLAIG